MALEDDIPTGFMVSRTPGGSVQPVVTVYGYGQQWTLAAGQTEDDLLALATNYKALNDAMQQGLAYFTNNFKNWATMTPTQKDTANQQLHRAMANWIHIWQGDFTTTGL